MFEVSYALGAAHGTEVLKFGVLSADLFEFFGFDLVDLYKRDFFLVLKQIMGRLNIEFCGQVVEYFEIAIERSFREVCD